MSVGTLPILNFERLKRSSPLLIMACCSGEMQAVLLGLEPACRKPEAAFSLYYPTSKADYFKVLLLPDPARGHRPVVG